MNNHQPPLVPVTETAIITSTPQPTPTVTPVPKVEVLELLPNEDGTYTDEQLAVISSDDFVEGVRKLNNWWLYWAYADKAQQPFPDDTENAMIVPYFDKDNPQSFSLAIQARMDDGNLHTFLQPIDRANAKLRDFPPIEIGTNGIPVEINYDIPVGLGPLEITGNFGWDETYEWVKFDENGNMYQTINYITGQWAENEAFKKKDFNFIYTVTSERLQAEMNYFKLYDYSIINLTESVGWPAIYLSGHIIGYQLSNYNNETFLNLLLVTKNGIVKANAYYIIIEEGPHPKPFVPITEITYESLLQ